MAFGHAGTIIDGTSSQTPTRRQFLTGAAAVALAALPAAALGATSAVASEYSASAETEAALADAQSRYSDAMDQLSYLNGLVFAAEAEYNSITEQLNATIQAIADLQVVIEQRTAELAEAQDVLADRVAANYRSGTTSMLDLLLNATDFDDFVSRLYYAGKVSDADAAAIQNVKDIKAALEADQASLQEQQAYQEQLQAEQAAQLEVLNAQVADTEAYAASLDSEVQALMAQRDAEIAAAAEAARQAAAAEAARQAEEAAASGGGDSGGSDGSDGSGGSGGGSAGYQPASVVSAGYNYIGTPYSVLDCSSFTAAAYRDCGYYLTAWSVAQYSTVVSKGNLVGAGSLVPGNLVFYSYSSGTIYHVGLYIGDGMVIDSIPNGGVQVRSMYFCDGFCGGGSPL